MTRISLLTEIPAPFRIPLFNALAAETGIELEVLFLRARDPKRPYPVYRDEFRFRSRMLRGVDVARGGRWLIVNAGVLRSLARFRPEVVIVGGWNQPAFWQALAYARARRLPLVVWVESTARDERPGRGLLERAKRALVESAEAFLVPGRASAEYMHELGVGPDRIVRAPNAVDASIFQDRVDELRKARAELRARLGIERVTILYAGRLDPEKGVDLLLDAMRDVDADLVLAGGVGSQAAGLRAGAPANARFLERLDRDALPEWYAAADIFVLPSRSDQWGMVLNEAAAAGLPIVATEAAGASHDLIEDGVSGFRVPTGDREALAGALNRLVGDAPFRASAGARSRELAGAFTPEAWAEAVATLARRLARQKP